MGGGGGGIGGFAGGDYRKLSERRTGSMKSRDAATIEDSSDISVGEASSLYRGQRELLNRTDQMNQIETPTPEPLNQLGKIGEAFQESDAIEGNLDEALNDNFFSPPAAAETETPTLELDREGFEQPRIQLQGGELGKKQNDQQLLRDSIAPATTGSNKRTDQENNEGINLALEDWEQTGRRRESEKRGQADKNPGADSIDLLGGQTRPTPAQRGPNPLSGEDASKGTRNTKRSLGRTIPEKAEKKSGSISKELAKSKADNSSAETALIEKSALQEPFSTFSLHVSDVSFKLARAALGSGSWPDPEKVRVEEFVNAFDYGDPMPSQSDKVACRIEQSAHPFLQQRNLMRVSMRTAAAGRSSSTPLRLTLLVDNSGSMERFDRQQTLRRVFITLAQQLQPLDQVTLISFARRPRLLADKVNGKVAMQLVQTIDNLPSEGGTNLESALTLAFEKALEQKMEEAQNRVILLTDGAVNLGNANPESLSQIITSMRGAGIAFDAAGINAEGLNDEVLKALTRQGDGRYYLLDSIETVDEDFARQVAGALRPAAKNVKVQVQFNPKRVNRYKLLGFEKHRLKKEDFRNDKVDAAEMAAEEAGVAVYQFEAKPDGEGDIGMVSVRFHDVSTGQMIENTWPILYEANAARIDQAAATLQLATSAALLAAKLRGDPLAERIDLRDLSNLVAELPERIRNTKRVKELLQMIQQARQLTGQ